MKKHFVTNLIVCLFVANAMQAQRIKKVFLDTQDSIVTHRAFKKKLAQAKGKVLEMLITDSDTLKVRKLFWREHQGRLNSIALEQLRKYLQRLTGEEIPKANYIVVNYYPGKDECNSPFFEKGRWSSYKASLNAYEIAVLSLTNASQYYFTHGQKPNPFEKTALIVHPDSTNLFKNVFFPYPFPCGSFVVIHPDGRYIKYYGEYPNQIILDILQANWELDFFWD
jgi:hypothetical protein